MEIEEFAMSALDKTAWEILNATADDCENLEQIYRQVCHELVETCDSQVKAIHDYRPIKGAPLLSEDADRIRKLVERGLLAVVMDEGGRPWQDRGEFYIESESGSVAGGTSVGFQLAGARAAVRVERDLQRAALEVDAKRTSLRFLDIDPDAEQEDDDTPRMSLQVVDGVPAFRAVDSEGETVFEQP